MARIAILLGPLYVDYQSECFHTDPVYMSRKIRKFRTDKFGT